MAKYIEMRLGDEEYTLATNLRVAYVIQAYNNHKSYIDVFKGLSEATIEKQLEMLYAAFIVANGKHVMDKNAFCDKCFDYLDVATVMDLIKQIIEGITGKTIDEAHPENIEAPEALKESPEGE